MKTTRLTIIAALGISLVTCSSNSVKNLVVHEKAVITPITENQDSAKPTENQSVELGLKEVDSIFYFKGNPISPFIIARFVPMLSDNRPSTLTIDILSATGSNEYYDTSSHPGTSVILDDNGASFSYEYVGKLQNGIHVIATFTSSGGSLTEEDLCFFSFKIRRGFESDGKKYDQLLMSLEKFYGIGNSKDFAKIKLSKNKAIIDGVTWGDDKPWHKEIEF